MDFTITIITMATILGAPSPKEQKLASLVHPKQTSTTRARARIVSKSATLASDIAAAMKSHRRANWGNARHYDKYARLFVRHGRRWGIDPVLVACVAMAESRYKKRPPPLYRQKCQVKMFGCHNPGPCYPHWRKVCRKVKVNVAEAGMMQVLYHDGSTRQGYKACTGLKLLGSKAEKQRKLRPLDVAICVGTYELSKWKKWATKGGYGRIKCGKKNGRCSRRMTPKKLANISFFQRYPKLKQLFWVSFYNWGSNRWKGNSYPRKVLWCYQSYQKKISKLRKMRKRPSK